MDKPIESVQGFDELNPGVIFFEHNQSVDMHHCFAIPILMSPVLSVKAKFLECLP